MFLKLLKISKDSTIIREIKFRKGINLIVDNSEGQITGNSVGKTTVLKLIDFCFGSNKKNIWIDPETKKDEYKLVKDYLVNKEILITLILTDDLDNSSSQEIIIERNFLSNRNKIIRRINGQNYTEDEFESVLTKILFPNHLADKPTFRQIISHNIRYKDININNTLKTLDQYTTDAEYETLYLFLLGCDFTKGNNKQQLLEKIRQENIFKSRLEKNQTKSAFESALSLLEGEIEELNQRKSSLNINENFASDLDALNDLKYRINKISSEISKLEIRRNLINESIKEIEDLKSSIDIIQLRQIYEQSTNILGELQKTFENMVEYHNNMLIQKKNFIVEELPSLIAKISQKKNELKTLLIFESDLSQKVSKSDSFEELEDLINNMNDKYRLKGEYENIIQQLNEVDNILNGYNQELETIDDEIFSDDFESIVKQQMNKFNKHFAYVSKLLYEEQYALKYDKVRNKKGQRLYKFSAFNTNFSSGKKQGEISCFDIAYTLFADEENITCMHFILNDKKELMHDNQLVKIANFVNQNGIQFVASILKDKLPSELQNDDYYVLELSEHDKLFKIESGNN